MTVIQKSEQFHQELKALLVKYKAEISLEDFGHDFSDYKVVVNFQFDESLYEENKTGIIPQLVLGYSEDGQ